MRRNETIFINMIDSSLSEQVAKTLSGFFCRHHRRGFGAEQRSGFAAACRKLLPDMRKHMEFLEIKGAKFSFRFEQ